MSPLAKLRVSTLACALFFSVSTAAQPAFAEVLISVNKSTQQMSVSADGVPRYRFAVSTGRAGYGTPNGTYHPQRLAASWPRLRAGRDEKMLSAEPKDRPKEEDRMQSN